MQQQRCAGLQAAPLAWKAAFRPVPFLVHRQQQPRLLAAPCRQHKCSRVCAAQQVNSESAETPPPPAADGSPHAPQLECFGTGMEVECRVVVDNVDGHAAPPEIAAQEAAAAAAQQEAHGALGPHPCSACLVGLALLLPHSPPVRDGPRLQVPVLQAPVLTPLVCPAALPSACPGPAAARANQA